MNKMPFTPVALKSSPSLRQRGGCRPGLLAAMCLLAGLAGGAYLQHRRAAPAVPAAEIPAKDPGLAESTRRLLAGLNAPVSLKYYALLDTNLPPAFAEFSAQTVRLLESYQQAAGQKLSVSRFTNRSDLAETAAARGGLRAFNLDRGDACYLGVILESGDRKEALSLSPDWAPALEADLSRALARVNAPAKSVAASTAEPDRAVVEEVKRALPDLASVSVAEGTKQLREQTLAAFTAVAREMEARLQQAERRHAQAASEAEKAAAIKEIQQVRAEQTEKLKALTIRMQEQINALEQIKRQ
jgi:hypothetical protein